MDHRHITLNLEPGNSLAGVTSVPAAAAWRLPRESYGHPHGASSLMPSVQGGREPHALCERPASVERAFICSVVTLCPGISSEDHLGGPGSVSHTETKKCEGAMTHGMAQSGHRVVGGVVELPGPGTRGSWSCSSPVPPSRQSLSLTLGFLICETG